MLSAEQLASLIHLSLTMLHHSSRRRRVRSSRHFSTANRRVALWRHLSHTLHTLSTRIPWASLDWSDRAATIDSLQQLDEALATAKAALSQDVLPEEEQV